MEQTFNPLRLSAEIEEQLENLKDLSRNDYSQYVDALRYASGLKVLRQVSVSHSLLLHSFLSSISHSGFTSL